MRITRVTIRNVLGIEAFEFVAGRFNSIVGDNSAGKSSLLKAIAGALGSGHRADLIRQGAEKGETVIEFDNGDTLTARFGANGTSRKVKKADGASYTAVQSWIEARLNPLGFNPIQFVEADNPTRREILLSIARLLLHQYELEAACGQFAEKSELDAGEQVIEPLATIENHEKRIYDLRTGLNRSVKDKRFHIVELQRTIPAGLEQAPDVDAVRSEYKAVCAQASEERKAIEARCADEKRHVEQAAKNTKAGAELKAQEDERAARQELQRKLTEIGSTKEQTLTMAGNAEKLALADVAAREKDLLAKLEDRVAPRREELREKAGQAEQLLKDFERAQGTRLAIAKSEEEAAKLDAESHEATAALKRLEVLRASLLEHLPVPGLEIVNGAVTYKGIPFESLNSAEQIDVALHLAEVASGDLKLIQLDGFEALGTAKREAVERWALESQCQFFCARVVDSAPLGVEVANEFVPAPNEEEDFAQEEARHELASRAV